MCLIAPVHEVPEKTLGTLLHDLHGNRPVTPVIDCPGHPQHGMKVCFHFITRNRGCKKCLGGRRCDYAHLDLDTELTQRLPRDLFQKIHTILLHRGIKPHYRPTNALVNHCNASG